jgi:HKD family nuclease
VGRSTGDFVEKQLFSAEKYLLICSPWIDSIYAVRAVSMARKNVQILILTSNDKSNEQHKKGLEELREAMKVPRTMIRRMKDHVPLPLNYRVINNKFIHPIMYCADGRYAVVGSAMLTQNDLWKNVEHLIIMNESDEVRKIETDFERLWRSYSKEEIREETSVAASDEFWKRLWKE